MPGKGRYMPSDSLFQFFFMSLFLPIKFDLSCGGINFLNTFHKLFSTLVSSQNLRVPNFFFFSRYRTNLVTAKENELSKKVLWANLSCAGTAFSKEWCWMEWRCSGILSWTGGSTCLIWCYLLIFFFLIPQKILQFKFSNQTYQEYNKYITAMVGCLWTSSAFQKDIHPQGISMDDELLKKTTVPDFKTSFNIVCHPAMMSYAFFYLQQVMTYANFWTFGSTRCSVLTVFLEKCFSVYWLTGRVKWAFQSWYGILCLCQISGTIWIVFVCLVWKHECNSFRCEFVLMIVLRIEQK